MKNTIKQTCLYSENPSKYDVTLEYYAETYHEDTYLGTIEFVVLVPVGRSRTVDVEVHFGADAVTVFETVSNPTFRYEVDYKRTTTVMGLSVTKSWSVEWDYTT